jgi:regulator of protease activity HflC (stomatin/prohibitin superfamily)
MEPVSTSLNYEEQHSALLISQRGAFMGTIFETIGNYGLNAAITVIGLVLLYKLTRMIVVIPQQQRGVLLTLGRYAGTKEPGLAFVIPFFQRLYKVDVRVAVMQIPAQDVISKDNVSVKVTAAIYYRVTDAKKALLDVEKYWDAVGQLAQITIRSTLGAHTLDELLGNQEQLNASIRKILDERTEAWGIEVQSVEIRSVDLDPAMVRAMGAEAEAERNRRAKIITAKGEAEAAEKLVEAATKLAAAPGAMQLRTLATLQTIASEKNSTIIFPTEMMGSSAVLPFLSKAIDASK